MNDVPLWKRLALIALALLIVYAVIVPPWAGEMAEPPSTEEVAKTVFEDYGFTFMVLSLLLAAAMIGGIFMAKIPYEFGRRIVKGKIVDLKLKPRKPARPKGGVR